MQPGTHGTTYGGNLLGMAVGNKVMDVVMADGFLEDVQQKAIFLKQKLAEVADSFPDLIEGVRGEGLMQGLKCKTSNLDVVGACREQNLLTVPAGDNVVRLLPPLTVTEAEMQEAISKVTAALTNLREAG